MDATTTRGRGQGIEREAGAVGAGRLRRIVTNAVAAAVIVGTGWVASPAAANSLAPDVLAPRSIDPTPPYIAPTADWLTTVNYYRAMTGVAPVTEDPALSAGSYQHSCYMLRNGITHDEDPARPGYTAEGDQAGNNGNVAVSSAFGTAARNHIDLWMTGPFHAIGVVRPALRTVGFGKCDDQATSPWQSAATLDVLRGLDYYAARPAAPVMFPGDGTTTSLTKFVTESPNPLTYCGWSGGAGLPTFAMMPEPVVGPVSASITGPDGALETCALWKQNTDGSAASILGGDNAVVAMPRAELTPGTYNVTITTATRTVTWSFTVDPAAATGVMPPAAPAQPAGPTTGFTPLAPARLVDTRIGQGATALQGGVTKRIQVTGWAGVPTGATAVVANVTVVGPAAASYLTAWNCSPDRPIASSLNFGSGDAATATANAATIGLDAGGGMCVYSPVATNLVVDVTGAMTTTATGRFSPLTPQRMMDTRVGFGATRLDADQTVELQVVGAAGVPAGATAVTMNLTSVEAAATGYVTAYPCGTERPVVSNLNPQPGRTRPNMVTVPLSADGRVCLYSLNPVDLVADITGYYATDGASTFTPSTPFRLIDTRDRLRTEVNAGTAGQQVGAGQVVTVQIAGVRGVPAGATAVSVNITTTASSGNGYLTAWPCNDRPIASTANMRTDGAVSNAAQLPLSATGTLCIFAQHATHVVVDVNGWWA
jgi:hypothetical protein